MKSQIEEVDIMDRCRSFETCDAPLCPLDPDLHERIWYSDEPVCKSRVYGQHRWIRKQRSIQRRRTACWLDRPVTYQQLYDASRPRQMTDEQRRNIAERLKQSRYCKVSAPNATEGIAA